MLNRLASWWLRQPSAGAIATAADAETLPSRLHRVPEPTPQNDKKFDSPAEISQEVRHQRAAACGLLDEPEFREFFALSHFGLGRHNGATYRTREALERGRDGVVARFCNSLERVAHRREVELRRLKDSLLEIEGVSQTTSRRIKQAIDCLEQDKATLQEQGASASSAQGWVSQAVIDYETGFAKGVYEAVAFQVHGRDLQ